MTDVKYDAALCVALYTEARYIASQPADVNEYRRLLYAIADQLAAARAEIERLQTERDSAVAIRDGALARAGELLRAALTMRPVVDAALASYGSQRGGHFGQPLPTDAMLKLADAVDAYRAARDKAGQ